MPGEYWYNPSTSAVIYDPRNNRHIQPGERVTTPPDNQLVRMGRLMRVDGGSGAGATVVNGPQQVVAAIETESEDVAELVLSSPHHNPKNEEVPDLRSSRFRRRKRAE